MESEKGTEYRYGLTVLNMKDTGATIKQMAKENSATLTGIYMTETG